MRRIFLLFRQGDFLNAEVFAILDVSVEQVLPDEAVQATVATVRGVFVFYSIPNSLDILRIRVQWDLPILFSTISSKFT